MRRMLLQAEMRGEVVRKHKGRPSHILCLFSKGFTNGQKIQSAIQKLGRSQGRVGREKEALLGRNMVFHAEESGKEQVHR